MPKESLSDKRKQEILEKKEENVSHEKEEGELLSVLSRLSCRGYNERNPFSRIDFQILLGMLSWDTEIRRAKIAIFAKHWKSTAKTFSCWLFFVLKGKQSCYWNNENTASPMLNCDN